MYMPSLICPPSNNPLSDYVDIVVGAMIAMSVQYAWAYSYCYIQYVFSYPK